MYSEHILYSIGLAIIIGSVFTYKYGRTIPVWIIAACAWLPDTDYIPHFIGMFLNGGHPSPIGHGDFHNVFAMIGLALLGAYLLNRYFHYDFKLSFILVTVGIVFHFICDYLVYPSIWHPFTKIFGGIELKALNLVPEHGSFLGIGEIPLILGGIAFLLFALIINYYLSPPQTVKNKIKAAVDDPE